MGIKIVWKKGKKRKGKREKREGKKEERKQRWGKREQRKDAKWFQDVNPKLEKEFDIC